jgi:hypothetical protein
MIFFLDKTLIKKTYVTLAIMEISVHKEFPVGKFITGNFPRDYPGEKLNRIGNYQKIKRYKK